MTSTTKTAKEIVEELQTAHAELLVAQEEHEHAKTAEDAARSRACITINRLNAAQKAVDRLTEELKRQAPWNSDWSNRGQRRVEVA